MRSVFLSSVVLLLCPYIQAQSLNYGDKLYEYRPAPGQHINDPVFGTPQVSQGIVNGIGNPLSLGAYGGYVILEFTNGVENHPDNPYGLDFIIYGNATSNHAEPGIVRVMKDENQNGIPDEPWYEIAGSARFTDECNPDYSIDYTNPKTPFASDVFWTDNLGTIGKVFKNSFHNQQYYPLNSLFPSIPYENMSFKGSRLTGNVISGNGEFASMPYAFGYADMIPVKNQILTGIPDNPYTSGITEGDGGDGIDISWAIDQHGQYADLQEINFIMIYTGVNASAGWLGEISTDIRGIVDVAPNKNCKGQEKMIIPDEILRRIALSDSLELSGRVFISGRPAKDEVILWETDNPAILRIDKNRLSAIGEGETLLKGFLASDTTALFSQAISVVVPKTVSLQNLKSIIQTGESFTFTFSLLDKSGEEVFGLLPEIIAGNDDLIDVTAIEDGRITLTGREPGTTAVSLVFKNYPELTAGFELQITGRLEPIRLCFALGDNHRSIIPGKNFTVQKTNLVNYINRYQKEYRQEKPYITLADAIACSMKEEGFGTNGNSLAFRQDEYGGNGLYVWQVGYNWEYQYGWGGLQTDDSHAKTWFAIVNDQVFASGFDTIEVYDGDRISLHHIEDSRDAWSLARIIPGKTEIEIDETVIFRCEQLDIYPLGNGEYSLSGPFPIVNGLVEVEPSVVNISSDLYTSFTGEFSLSFNQAGTYQISVGNSEPVLVTVNFPLSIAQDEVGLNFYPNPCTDNLNINNLQGKQAVIRIYSSDGSLKIINRISEGTSAVSIDMSNLEAGFYIMEYSSEGRISKQKLCKQ